MFAYCRNSPVFRVDVSGTYDLDCNDTDPIDDELVHEEGGLGGSDGNSTPQAGNSAGNSFGFGKAPKQSVPGSTYTQYSSDGQNSIVSQTTYGELGAPSQRVDYQGRDHGVGLPHVHEFSWTRIGDKVCPTGERIYRLMRI